MAVMSIICSRRSQIAAGFEARLAMLADRGDIFFDRKLHRRYTSCNYSVAVKVGNEWRFFDRVCLTFHSVCFVGKRKASKR